MRIEIRKDDYYGGDITVEYEDDGSDVVIRWEAWGGYGESVIGVKGSVECDALAAALTAAADLGRETDALESAKKKAWYEEYRRRIPGPDTFETRSDYITYLRDRQ